MSYSVMGATSAPTFKMVGGIAKPTPGGTDGMANLNAFKEFQAQLNRFGKGTVTVDGDIGPATARIYNSIMNASATPAQIATNIPAWTYVLKGLATAASLPAPKPIPPTSVKKRSDGTVTNAVPPPAPEGSFVSTAIDFVATPMGMLVTGAGMIGVIYLATRKKKAAPVAAPVALPTIPKVA